MVQCFKAVNLDKREFICPWCMHEGAGLTQWAVGRHSGVLSILTCQSSVDREDSAQSYVIASEVKSVVIAEVSHKSIFKDESPTSTTVTGRWAGDRVCLIGDHDASGHWDELPSYVNITEAVVEEWNRLIHGEDAQLAFNHCGCSAANTADTDRP